jgi:stress response protein SCP2
MFSNDLIKVLETLSNKELISLNEMLTENMSIALGDNVNYTPLFKRFPEDVPDHNQYLSERIVGYLESECGIIENARLLSCGHLINTETFDITKFGACPICQCQVNDIEIKEPVKRKKLREKTKLKLISLAKSDEIITVFKNLVSSNTSISESDKEDLKSILFSHKDELIEYFPETIPHKEILATVSEIVLEQFHDYNFLTKSIKTSTDVLRIATALSGGDVSLATNTLFKKFKRKERKFLLSSLENCKNIQEDMLRYKYNWIRLGEILHPGEYKKRFPKALNSFKILRNDVKIETFNSKTEELCSQKSFVELAKHLKTRPSELARRLDYIVTNTQEKGSENVINVFSEVVEKIPTTVLLQVMSNFKIRSSKEKDIRIIIPKGNVCKVKVLEEKREPIKKGISSSVIDIIKTELTQRFSNLPSLGKVYVDDNLRNYVVPFSQRSASKALSTITRGSQVNLTNENTVRMFLYWKEGDGTGRIDVDLSAVMYDEKWNYKDHLSFTNLKGLDCAHSGDVQSAPNGAAEFIDINKKSLLEHGVRYVMMSVNSWTGQSFNKMPEAFAGVMGRKSPKSGEIFEPKTVKQKYDLSTDTKVSIPLILDLKENKMIWADIALNNQAKFNSVESHKENAILMGKAITNLLKFKTNIYDLLELHILSRGEMVDKKEKADIVFSEENIPFETERIMSEFLV